MSDLVRLAKGQDAVVEITVRAGWDEGEVESVKLAAASLAAATSLTIEPLKYALASGDMLLFPGNIVITLSSAAAIGATTLACTSPAAPGPLRHGMVGEKLRDLTGYTTSLEVLSAAGDATPAMTAIAGVNQTQSATDGRGRVRFTFTAVVTAAVESKRYAAAMWRTDSGSKRPLWEGDLEVYDAGLQ